jgi:hypothetical protein
MCTWFTSLLKPFCWIYIQPHGSFSSSKGSLTKKNMYGDEEGRVYMHHNCMNKREFSSRTQNLHTNSGCHNL